VCVQVRVHVWQKRLTVYSKVSPQCNAKASQLTICRHRLATKHARPYHLCPEVILRGGTVTNDEWIVSYSRRKTIRWN